MKRFNIFFCSFAAWCFLSISAYSQLPTLIQYGDVPSSTLTLEEVRQSWLSTHYGVYGEDISNEQYTSSVRNWLQYLFSDNQLVPFYYIVTTQRLSSVSSLGSIGQLSQGIEFVGAWPVFLLLDGGLVPPEWCTFREFLNKLPRFGSSVLDSLVSSWDYYYSLPGKPNFSAFDDTPGEWGIRFKVENASTRSKVSFVLPVTRLYLMLPYYPSWWAMGGGYFAVDYDDALMLSGPSLGSDAPYSDYDGYVLFSTNRVKLVQKYQWSSPE